MVTMGEPAANVLFNSTRLHNFFLKKKFAFKSLNFWLFMVLEICKP
jgi:hypothetical protein